MKILFVLFLSMFALLLGGCAEQPLMTDEEYTKSRPPAAYSPDYSGVLPQANTRPGWQ